ncbi:peptidylprolyl isomerase [bacterium]|nr:peptidylprolyl isomerase [bacterium]
MGMMTKMRDNAHVFIIAFIVVFVAFWVISDVDIGSIMQGSANEIGNVGGKSITYQEYQAVVDRVAEQRRQQNEGRELTENDFMQIREQVWNDFVTQSIVENAIEEFGITVSDQEITDWVWDLNNPPEQLAQYFKDSTGRFNAQAYEQFLRNPGPENQEALIAVEQQLKSELLRSKLTNILTSSVIVSEDDVRWKYIENNIDFNVSYVFWDPRVFAASDTSEPTDAEYQSYYEKNKDRFKIEDMRVLKYVLFPDAPSKSDTAAVLNELNNISKMVSEGSDFLEMVELNSETPYDSTQWSTRENVPEQVADKVFDVPVGTVVGPIPNETGLSLYKVMDSRTGDQKLYSAAHILFRTDGGQDEAAQKAKAEEVLAKAKSGEDFAKLAAQYSEEPGAADRGGKLPWFSKGRMVPEFENAVMNARAGQIVGPVKTQFGYHIIKVNGSSNREVKLAEIRMSIRAGSRTMEEIFEKARNFAYFANENGFEQEANAQGLQVQETAEFAKQTGSYVPGIGTNPALMRFAFDNSVGDISEVHRASNGYVVAMLADTRDAGYRPLDEVRDQIRAQVIYERQVEKTFDIAKQQDAGGKSLDALANSSPNLNVTTPPPFKLQNGVPNIGPDQAFIGKMLKLEPGKSTAPFRGLRGIYVVRLLSKSDFDDTAYKVKKDELRKQELSSLQNEFVRSWIEEKRDDIDIVDNRHKFFR